MEDVYGRRIPKDKFIAKSNVTDKITLFEDNTSDSVRLFIGLPEPNAANH